MLNMVEFISVVKVVWVVVVKIKISKLFNIVLCIFIEV